MHIRFLTHYFPPEVNAPVTRTDEHCARWARTGHDVTVVTCVPNCPDGVITLADNPHLTARLGQVARQYVADYFDRDELAAE